MPKRYVVHMTKEVEFEDKDVATRWLFEQEEGKDRVTFLEYEGKRFGAIITIKNELEEQDGSKFVAFHRELTDRDLVIEKVEEYEQIEVEFEEEKEVLN